MDLNLSALKTPTAPNTTGAGSIRETTTKDFENDVLRLSMQKPVVVDFWAPWCGPCKQLMPVLEKVIGATNGAIEMIKVNIDQNPELAQIFRVQSVPMVYAFFQGQPVDGFMGVRTESELKAFIDKLKAMAGNDTAPAEPGALDPATLEQIAKLDEKAAAFLRDEKYEEAMGAYSMILDLNPAHNAALAGIGWCLLASGDVESVREIVSNLTDEQKADKAFAGLQLIMSKQSDADIDELEQKLTAHPKDHATRYQLAEAYLTQGRVADAIEALIELTRRDREWNDQQARKLLLELFDAMGPGHPLTAKGRRKLSSVLFA